MSTPILWRTRTPKSTDRRCRRSRPPERRARVAPHAEPVLPAVVPPVPPSGRHCPLQSSERWCRTKPRRALRCSRSRSHVENWGFGGGGSWRAAAGRPAVRRSRPPGGVPQSVRQLSCSQRFRRKTRYLSRGRDPGAPAPGWPPPRQDRDVERRRGTSSSNDTLTAITLGLEGGVPEFGVCLIDEQHDVGEALCIVAVEQRNTDSVRHRSSELDKIHLPRLRL